MAKQPGQCFDFQLAKTRHEKHTMINATTPARGRGRPCKVNPLTPAERSQRYRDRKRAELQHAVEAILAQLVAIASKPYDHDEESRWHQSFADQCNQIDEEFRELTHWFDNSSSGLPMKK